MSVTLSIGGMPVPKGWKLWHDKCRPDPGRMFYELRYHHGGEWKLGLDSRPMNGAFPEFWMPPLAWRYAHELEALQKALELSVLSYGEQWKKKKKLLFGAPEGKGMEDMSVSADYVLQGWEWGEPITHGMLTSKLLKSLTGAAMELKEPLPGGHALQFGVDHTGKPMLKNSWGGKEWTMQGMGWPEGYDLVPFDTMNAGVSNLPVRLTITGAMQNLAIDMWEFEARMDYRKDNDFPYPKPATMMLKFDAPLKGKAVPKIEVLGISVEEMNKKKIRLFIYWIADNVQLPPQEVTFKVEQAPQLFPPHGLIKGKPYWVSNPKFTTAE
jgi:hypothetical protein